MMQVVEPPKAVLDFQNKTIQFQGDFKLSDIKKVQDSLVNWDEWRIVTAPAAQITYTPYTGSGFIDTSGTKAY